MWRCSEATQWCSSTESIAATKPTAKSLVKAGFGEVQAASCSSWRLLLQMQDIEEASIELTIKHRHVIVTAADKVNE